MYWSAYTPSFVNSRHPRALIPSHVRSNRGFISRSSSLVLRCSDGVLTVSTGRECVGCWGLVLMINQRSDKADAYNYAISNDNHLPPLTMALKRGSALRLEEIDWLSSESGLGLLCIHSRGTRHVSSGSTAALFQHHVKPPSRHPLRYFSSCCGIVQRKNL